MNLFKKYKKTFTLMMILGMLLQMLTPVGVNIINAEEKNKSTLAAGKDLGNIFTDVKLTMDDVEIPAMPDIPIETIEIGTKEFKMDFIWEIDDAVSLAENDFVTFQLPEQMNFLYNNSGTLKWDIGGVSVDVANYTIDKDTRTVTIIFNNVLVGLVQRKGTFWLKFDFITSKFDEDAKQIINFKTNPEKKYEITLKPPKGKLINKIGEPDNVLNAKNITWTVDVNTSLSNMENAIVADTLPAGLELESVKIYKLKVGYNGSLVEELSSETFVIDGTKVTLGKIDSAYRIVYVTKITDSTKTEFLNNVELKKGVTVIAIDNHTVTTKIGSPITKFTGTPNDANNAKSITWRIQANLAQMELKKAKIKDTLLEATTGALTDKLELQKIGDKYSVRVFELNIATDGDITKGPEVSDKIVSYDSASKELVINLGDTSKAYEIEYITDIVFDREKYTSDNHGYGKSVTFDNTASLTQGESDIEVGTSTSSATVKRAEILSKEGTPNIKPDSKTVDWVIKVNEAEDVIYDVWIEDKSGSGISLVAGSLEVIDKNGEKLTKDASGGYQLLIPSDTPEGAVNDFKVILPGKRSQQYTIKYTTEITDFNQTESTYENAALISWIPANNAEVGGSGAGSGEGEVGTGGISTGRIYLPVVKKGVKAEVINTYGKSYVGINYVDKTINWEIKHGFYKGVTKDLIITDTFTNKGLVFLENTLIINHKVNGLDAKTLTKGTDYSIKAVDHSYGNGFIIEFLGDYKTKKFVDSELIITYQTSFDPDTAGYIANTSVSSVNARVNEAKFTGNYFYKEITTPIEETKIVELDIPKTEFDNGQKTGILNRDARTISWKIYANYLDKDLKEPLVIDDTITDGQEMDYSSIKVYNYKIKEKGELDETAKVLISNKTYEIIQKPEKLGFTFKTLENADSRYLIEYDTKILGISKELYTNTATVTGGNVLEAKVPFNGHDKFLFKEAVNIEGGRVWIDDIINWKIKINESLSAIDKDAKLTDSMSDGLVLVKDSVKVFKSDGKSPLENSKYTTLINDEYTMLTITFNEKIEEMYFVEYQTVVTKKTGEVSNTASFNGTGISGKTTSTIKSEIKQSSGGTGSGIQKKGMITLHKKSKDGNLITTPAKFKVYYLLNEEVRYLNDGEEFLTNKGVLKIQDLSFRKYFIEETAAPEGFEFDKSKVPIEVDVKVEAKSDLSGSYLVDVENNNVLISVTAEKTWINGPINDRPIVKLELYRNGLKMDVAAGEILNGEKTHTWLGLKKTDNAGKNYIYTVKEVGKPINYDKNESGLTVTNTYVIPKINITGNKVWVGGPKVHPTIELQLYQDGVKHLSPVELKNGENAYTWTALDKTDINGVEHIYRVDEVKTPYSYSKSVSPDGLTVTNRYYSPSTDVLGKKVWVNGPDVKPTVQLQLYINGSSYGDPVTLVNGTTEHIWPGLSATDSLGNPISYTVKEVNTPDNYVKSESGLTVTNTYVIPKIDVTGNKVWVGGPAVKPSIQLQLYQNDVKYLDPITLNNGETTYTWKDLDKTDVLGKVYEYTVKEVDTPKDYVAYESGLTITNRHLTSKIDITGYKVWDGGTKVKPTILIQLYQNDKAYSDPITLVDGQLSYTWKNLDFANTKGEVYKYRITEVKTPKDYITFYSEDGLTITNVYQDELAGVKPEDPNGGELGSNKPSIPNTGIDNNQFVYTMTLLAAGAGLVALSKRKKELNQ